MTDYALPAVTDYLDPAARAQLQALGNRQYYTDGAVIQRRGDPDPAMALVIQGAVKLLRVTADGRQVLMLTAGAGQHYADNTVLSKSKRTHHAVAVGDTIVDHYPHDVFLKLMDNLAILQALYRVTVARLGQAIELFDDIRCLPPEVRLAKTLASVRTSMDGTSRLEIVQEDLASLLGISAMTLSKALKSLKKQALVETGYRTITILDHQRFDAWMAAQDDQ